MPAITVIFAVLTIVAQLAVVVVLVRKFLRTRDVGILWLGAAVVIWPFVSTLLDAGGRFLLDDHVRGHLAGFFPFSLVERGQMTLGSLVASFTYLKILIGAVLLLVAVLHLSKTNSDDALVRTHPTGPENLSV
jgi:hypothetical protein